MTPYQHAGDIKPLPPITEKLEEGLPLDTRDAEAGDVLPVQTGDPIPPRYDGAMVTAVVAIILAIGCGIFCAAWILTHAGAQ